MKQAEGRIFVSYKKCVICKHVVCRKAQLKNQSTKNSSKTERLFSKCDEKFHVEAINLLLLIQRHK